MLPFKTILFPTDFSATSAFAFRMACALARDYGSRIVLLHVAEPPYAISEIGPLVMPIDIDRITLEAKMRQIRPEYPQVVLDYRLAQGSPPEEIINAAQDIGADVIVLGTHGRRGLSRLLMGSVAELVLRGASCPVIAVKAPPPPVKAAGTDNVCEVAPSAH